MSEQEISPVIPKSEPKKGNWTKFEWYKDEKQVITEALLTIRKFPPQNLLQDRVDPSSRPPDEPLPFDIEVTALMSMGAFGEEGTSMLTTEEFLTVAPTIWELDESGMEDLREKIIPAAQEAVDKQTKDFAEEGAANIEALNLSFLEKWDLTRLDTLTKLFTSVSDTQVPVMSALLQRYNNMNRDEVQRIVGELVDIRAIEETVTRREQIAARAARVRDIASEFTFLVPSDLDTITTKEQHHGYLFLDSLRDILPTLYQTAAVARREYHGLTTSGYFSASGNDAGLQALREVTLTKLLYGAKDNHSSRGIRERLLKKGSQIRDQVHTARPDH